MLIELFRCTAFQIDGNDCKLFPIEPEKIGTFDPNANASRTIAFNPKYQQGKHNITIHRSNRYNGKPRIFHI
jgi:hypothetical protein